MLVLNHNHFVLILLTRKPLKFILTQHLRNQRLQFLLLSQNLNRRSCKVVFDGISGLHFFHVSGLVFPPLLQLINDIRHILVEINTLEDRFIMIFQRFVNFITYFHSFLISRINFFHSLICFSTNIILRCQIV